MFQTTEGRRRSGPEDPDVAASLENYAVLLRKNGRQAEAARLETRAEADSCRGKVVDSEDL